MFPSKENLTICFAHAAYQMQACFELRNTGVKCFQVRSYDEFLQRVGEADVVSVSGMWKNDLIPHAKKLKYIQSISSGMNQFSEPLIGAANIRLCSGAGVNAVAVAEHAIALVLAVARRLPEARDNQHKKFWRGMIGDLTQREDEVGSKTVLIVGLGRIGLARQPWALIVGGCAGLLAALLVLGIRRGIRAATATRPQPDRSLAPTRLHF